MNASVPGRDADLTLKPNQSAVLFSDRHRPRNAERTAAGEKGRLAVRSLVYRPCNTLGCRLGLKCALAHRIKRVSG
jgi:hypothetical protein